MCDGSKVKFWHDIWCKSPKDRTAMDKQACGPMGKDRRVVEKPSSRVCL
jgi:hypothetical protein